MELTELLAETGESLSALLAQLPPLYTTRRLMEAGDSARQLLQRVCGDPRGGVLQENAQGAVRVLPEGRESLLLYAASSDMETAQELCGQAEAFLRGYC
ncbi:nucleoside-diphosphate-sugar pyrophosphorylase /transl_table=11 involved in lipopolysaccharide biosynthesis/translation initiation factor 2B gamma/epsilon subunits (EIF-2Bgamma/eIF-2Bepsilon) [Ruminococcus sp. CAG:379]|nr:nucleoside-diphosphate-sugar pyrophosphorylase /transl_table=11 involved in lipopolysaccharide biosynthesis/translation initiation factor 2B gamma/epsilon subunits (EIF-2Bgamma/eIF-2Bepsilon) [Ruminococcus sp. CAG:379]